MWFFDCWFWFESEKFSKTSALRKHVTGSHEKVIAAEGSGVKYEIYNPIDQ